MKPVPWQVLRCLVLGLLGSGIMGPLSSQAHADDPLELVATVEVGGEPSALAVDHGGGRNDVILYGSHDGSRKVRFLDAGTLALAPETIPIPGGIFEYWIAYDRHHQHAYVPRLQRHQNYDDVWNELRVHVIAERTDLGSFSVNDIYNPDPLNREDRFYGLDGLALKQPMSEGDNPGRLIFDDTANGNIDVIDLNAAGTGAARKQRYSYRPTLCGESSCGWSSNYGNTLALEAEHETLGTDDLSSTDLLYISDKNHASGYGLRALRLSHPLEDLAATALPDVDLQQGKCGIGGCQGIAMSGARDILYAASGNQSFAHGYVDEVDTTGNQLEQVITLDYSDRYFVHVDWFDANRVFVGTYDEYGSWDPHFPSLYLHLIYDGTVVDTLRVMDNYDEYNGLRAMAFDPYLGRLYLAVASKIIVVQVNYGAPPACSTPLIGVAISGPTAGNIDHPYFFQAIPAPAGASEPITFEWSPEPESGQGTAHPMYQWAGYGPHQISLTAENCGGSGQAAHTIEITDGPWYYIYLPIVMR